MAEKLDLADAVFEILTHNNLTVIHFYAMPLCIYFSI